MKTIAKLVFFFRMQNNSDFIYVFSASETLQQLLNTLKEFLNLTRIYN